MTFPREAVLAQLAATHDGAPWYGTSRTMLLEGVSAAAAAAVPPGGGPSVWALVLHMTSWTREVTRRLRGEAADAPEDGDWPPLPTRRGAREWAAALRRLEAAHAMVVRAARSVPTTRWNEPVVWADGGPGETTLGETLVGLAQHDAYHIGQVALVLRAVRASDRA
jgi:uncharacterized damage-inducible protein DinB